MRTRLRKNRNKMLFLIVPTALVVCLVSLVIGAETDHSYAPNQMEFYLEKHDLEYIRPGLHVEIQGVDIQGATVTATVRLTDDKGVALDRAGILTPGPVELNFILARIKKGERQYTAYTTRMEPSPTTGELFLQATKDQGGFFADQGDGVYTYTFGTKLGSDFDSTVTHTVGIYATRDLSEFGLKNYVANSVFDFVPDGSQPTVVRDVVRTENCNSTCHDPLAVHGGGARRDVRLCVLCHTPQTTDHVSGNPVDMKIMVHKIHRGKDLPSVEAGRPYFIEDEDFSEVKFPQEIRNCTVCHQKGEQSNNYLTMPSRAACGACHDDVNFDTGENHGAGGVQVSDDQCTLCHAPDTGREFDISIKGGHTIPWKSSQLTGLHYKILSVDGAVPGGRPTIVFKITDNEGNIIDPATLDRVRLGWGGPTSDSVFGIRHDARGATPVSGGYSYQLDEPLPADAAGTWVVGTEGFRDLTLTKVDGSTVAVREAASNDLFFIGITDSPPVRRRTIVSGDKCNSCHERLALHGTSRQNVEYCSVCHRAGFTDEDQRPPDQLPAEALDFKHLVHRIHTGHELENEFTVFDAGEAEEFNEVRFSGDRRNCSKCHEGTSYQLPLPEGLLSTINPRGFFSPTPPASTACLGCHDGISAAAHAFVNIAPFGEGCASCHGEGREFAVSRVHAR